MDEIKAAGYQPLLYASSSVLQNNINTPSIVKKYPNSLWVAAYAISGRVDKPNFKYFPSMDGVAIWQYTDNWKGMSTDGNVTHYLFQALQSHKHHLILIILSTLVQ